jgi:predicted membrane protein
MGRAFSVSFVSLKLNSSVIFTCWFIYLFIGTFSMLSKRRFALVNAKELEAGHFFLTKNEDKKNRIRVTEEEEKRKRTRGDDLKSSPRFIDRLKNSNSSHHVAVSPRIPARDVSLPHLLSSMCRS